MEINNDYPSFNVYRGLQKPLVLFGLKGQNIYWGAGTFALTLITVLSGIVMFGFLTSSIMGIVVVAYGWMRINRNIKRGLHNKKYMKGTWIVKNIVKSTY